jgi:hypothetical protein
MKKQEHITLWKVFGKSATAFAEKGHHKFIVYAELPKPY